MAGSIKKNPKTVLAQVEEFNNDFTRYEINMSDLDMIRMSKLS